MSMYAFTDSVQTPATASLPAEAMQVNGVYLENVIPGYRTLSVSGREGVDAEIEELVSPTRDGALIHTKRLTPRTITVRFQLLSGSDTAFRQAFNRINGILRPRDLTLIFADEPDVYFTGTKVGIHDVTAGRSHVTGEIEIYCADPLKYSVEETSIQADADGVFDFDYDGTYPSYPRLVASLSLDLGFVAFINQDEKILQIGDPDGGEVVTAEKSVVSINDDFRTSLPSGWTRNAANLGTEGSGYVQGGTLKVETARYHGACANSYGTGSGWHGTAITKAIPADETGAVGAKNFKAEFTHFFSTGTYDDVGRIMLVITDGTGSSKKNIATIDLYKWKTAVNDGQGRLYVNGKEMQRINFTCDWYNSVTGSAASPNKNKASGSHSIEKFGSQITFVIAGKAYRFVVPAIESMKATEVSVFFAAHGTQEPVKANVLRTVRFIWHNAGVYEEVPNKLFSGDLVEADTSDGTIRVNGVDRPELGALGNDWEDFALLPGTNTIQCTHSTWGEAPVYTLYYRKAYL